MNPHDRKALAAIDYASAIQHAGQFAIGIDLIECEVIVLDRQSDRVLVVPMDELRTLAAVLMNIETQLFLLGLVEE